MPDVTCLAPERLVAICVGGSPVGPLNPVPTTGGGGGGGGAVTIADGADVNAGATTDAAVVGDVPGTLSAKLRGLSRILNDAWSDPTNSLRVTVVSGGGSSVITDIQDGAGDSVMDAVNNAMRTVLATAIPAGTNNIGDVDVLTLPAVTQGTSPWVISGAVTGSKSNNAAAPGATNVGALGAIANAAAPSLTEGNLVALSVDLAGNQRVTGTVAVSGTPTVNQGTSPWVVGDGGGSLTVDSVDGGFASLGATTDAAAAGNGTLIAIQKQLRLLLAAGLPAALVGGRLDVNIGSTGVTQPVSGTVTANAGTGVFGIAGAKTNNAAAPGATNVGSLSAVANAAAPTWTEGNLVALSVDLAGNQRITGTVDTELPAAAALADGAANPTAPAVGAFELLWNGATWDRVKSANAAAGTTGTGLVAAGGMVFDTTNWQKRAGDTSGRTMVVGAVANAADAAAVNPVFVAGIATATTNLKPFEIDANGNLRVRLQVGGSAGAVNPTNADALATVSASTYIGVTSIPFGFNGTTFDRVRTANAVAGTTGTGLLGAGAMIFDATNWQKIAGDTSGRTIVVGAAAEGAATTGNPVLIAGLSANGSGNARSPRVFTITDGTSSSAGMATCSQTQAFNGTTWDNARAANTAAATTGTGLMGSGNLVFDATNWQKWLGDTSGRGVVAGSETDGSALSGAKPILVCFGDATNARVPVLGTQGNGDANSSGVRAIVVSNYGLTYNGTTWDRIRSAESGQGTASTGILGVGNLVYDSNAATWVRQIGIRGVADGGTASGSTMVASIVFNGATYDRQRSANSAATTTGTGLLGAGNLIFDGTNWQKAVQASSMVGVQRVAQQFSFSHLATNATTTVKSGAGVLHGISVNTKGITNTVTVYDNTAGSGTVIAVLDTTLGQDTLMYDVAFATGLTVVVAGGTAADITISYA